MVREDVWHGDHVSEKVLHLSQDYCAPHYMINRALDIWEEGREVGRERDRKEEIGGRGRKGSFKTRN